MLMKPRRWLAYTIEVNDRLPEYSQIVDRSDPQSRNPPHLALLISLDSREPGRIPRVQGT